MRPSSVVSAPSPMGHPQKATHESEVFPPSLCRPMGGCDAIGPSSVQAYGIAGDTHSVHVLNNGVVPAHRITVRTLLQPGPSTLVLDTVFLAGVHIDAVAIADKLMLPY